MTEAARRLLLLRHGRTAWNAELRWQGHADVALDALGVRQAARAAEAMAALAPVALWSSDLARARQTADAVAARTGLAVRTDARLREFDVGDRTGLTIEEYAVAYPAEHERLRASGFSGFPNDEPVDRVAARMRAALTEAVGSLAPGETGVVVVHGGSGKLGVLELLGWPAQLYGTIRGLDNCAWAELEGAGPAGRLRLVRWNVSVPESPDFASPEGVG